MEASKEDLIKLGFDELRKGVFELSYGEYPVAEVRIYLSNNWCDPVLRDGLGNEVGLNISTLNKLSKFIKLLEIYSL